jgi:hypothetical protein
VAVGNVTRGSNYGFLPIMWFFSQEHNSFSFSPSLSPLNRICAQNSLFGENALHTFGEIENMNVFSKEIRNHQIFTIKCELVV